jgi:uncharacterized membrane protein
MRPRLDLLRRGRAVPPSDVEAWVATHALSLPAGVEPDLVRPAQARPGRPRRWLGPAVVLVALLVLDGLAVLDLNPFFLRSTLAFLLLFVAPGVAVLSLAGLTRLALAEALVNAVGISLALTMLSGFLLDSVLHALGVPRPLDGPFALVWVNASLVLLYATVLRVRDLGELVVVPRLRPTAWSAAAVAVPVFCVVLTLLGTTLLNNDGSNVLVVEMFLLVAAGLLATGVVWRRLPEGVWPVALYSYSLSLLLVYSMRSWHILGYDVAAEYFVFSRTTADGHWTAYDPVDAAYNACLSITLLPTTMHHVLAISPEYVFKFWMQLLGALVPVALYLLYRSYVKPVVAFFACMFLAMQTWFYEEISALIRQEIAYVFLALLLFVIFSKRYGGSGRVVLIVTYSIGLVISHYSTSYVWVATLGLSLVVGRLGVATGRLESFRLVRPWMLGVTAGVVLVWGLAITGSAANLGQLADTVSARGGDALSIGNIKRVISQVTFSGAVPDAQVGLDEQYASTLAHYRDVAGEHLYPDSKPPYRPTVLEEQPIQRVHRVPQAVETTLLTASKLVKAGMITMAPLVGLLLLLRRRAPAVLLTRRRRHAVDPEFVVVGLSVLTLVGLLVAVPPLRASYNITRLSFQAFMLLSLPAVLVVFTVVHKIRPRWAFGAVAAVLTVVFLYNTQVLLQLMGGRVGIEMNQPGDRLEPFYAHDAEVASARWLVEKAKPSDLLYADDMAILRVRAFGGGRPAEPAVFPTTIDRRAFVYLNTVNTGQRRAFVAVSNDMITIAYPIEFLERNKNLVYSSRGSRIYR